MTTSAPRSTRAWEAGCRGLGGRGSRAALSRAHAALRSFEALNEHLQDDPELALVEAFPEGVEILLLLEREGDVGFGILLRGEPKARKVAAFYLRNGTLIAVDAVNSAPEFLASRKLIMTGAKIAPEMLSDTTLPMKDIAASSAGTGSGEAPH